MDCFLKTASLHRLAVFTALMVPLFLELGALGPAAAGQPPAVPTRIESMVPLEIMLSASYELSTRGAKTEYFVHYITQSDPEKDAKFASMGIYAGASPSAFCPPERVKILKTWQSAIGPWTAAWRSCPSRKQGDNVMQETLIDPNKKGLLLHIFIVGNDMEEMKALEKIANTLRLANP